MVAIMRQKQKQKALIQINTILMSFILFCVSFVIVLLFVGILLGNLV